MLVGHWEKRKGEKEIKGKKAGEILEDEGKSGETGGRDGTKIMR